MKRLVSGLLSSLWTIVAATAIASLLLVFLVRDPIYFQVNTTRGLSADEISFIRDEFNLHSWSNLYFSWLNNIISGNLGNMRRGGPVVNRLLWPFMRTGMLCLLSVLITMGTALMFVAAVMAGGANSRAIGGIRVILSFLQGLPLFMVATILWSLYAWLNLLGHGADALFMAALLPATALMFADGSLASLAAEVLGEAGWLGSSDHVRAARARGLPEWRLLFLAPGSVAAHVLRNMMVVIVERIRARILYVIGGALVVERVFDYNGIGVLLLDDGLSHGLDFNLIMAVILITAFFVAGLRLLADIALYCLDPGIRADIMAEEKLRLHRDFLPSRLNLMENIRELINVLFPRMNRGGRRRWQIFGIMMSGAAAVLGILVFLHLHSPEAGARIFSAIPPTLNLALIAASAVFAGLAIALLSEWSPVFFSVLNCCLKSLETIPLYFVAVVILAALSSAGRASTYHLMAIVGIYLSVTTVRVMQGKFAEARQSEAWLAGAVAGAGRGRLTLFYLLPNCSVNLLTTLCDQVGYTLHVAANLAFLGAGEYHNNLAALSGQLGDRLFRLPEFAVRTMAPVFGRSWEESHILMFFSCAVTVILIMTLNGMARVMLAGSRNL